MRSGNPRKRNTYILLLTLCMAFAGTSCTAQPTPSHVNGITQLIDLGDINAMVMWDGDILAGGRDGVFRIEASGLGIHSLEIGEPLRYVKSLCVDEDENLWIVHEQGLTWYDGHTARLLTTQDGLPDNRINYVYADSHGDIWVGTWSGAAVLDRKTSRVKETFTTADGLLVDMVNVLMEDRYGGMWFGSYAVPGGGISFFDGNTWQYFDVDSGLPNNNVTAILQDAEGDIWVGTGFYDKGGAAVFEINGKDWDISRTVRKDDGLAGEKVRSLYQDRAGRHWIGSEYDGLVRMENDRIDVMTESEGLTNNEVKSMLQDENGRLWIATRNGITITDPDRIP